MLHDYFADNLKQTALGYNKTQSQLFNTSFMIQFIALKILLR